MRKLLVFVIVARKIQKYKVTKIDYIYDFEGYSGPEPFACELILPARKYGKNKAVKHPELTTVCTCTKCQAMPSIERE